MLDYFSRFSSNTCVLLDCIAHFKLYAYIDLQDTIAPYTFINYNTSTSRIDFFGVRIIK